MPEPTHKGTTKATSEQDELKQQAGHQHVIVGLKFQPKDANDRLGSELRQLQDRGREVGQHRAAADAAGGAASAATADLADALSSGASNKQVQAALSHLHDVVKEHGENLVRRRSGEKGAGPTAHLQNQLDKAKTSLQQAEADLGRIVAAGQSAASHGSGVVHAGSGGQAANNVGGLFGDLAEAIDALGDLIGGPLGAALSAVATVIGSIGDIISAVFGSGGDGSGASTEDGNATGDDSGDQDTAPEGEGDGEGTFGGGIDGGGCFTGSTTVLMADGSRRPIGELAVGDVVLGRDEVTGATDAGVIERVFVHSVGRTLTLRLLDGTDVETTSVHRFATAAGDFVDAGSLRPGDELATRRGPLVVDETVDVTHPATVYNLTVARLHTYFVGDSDVWVHNAKRQEEEPPDDGGDDDDD